VLLGEVKNRRSRLLKRTAAAEGRGAASRRSPGGERAIRYDDPASAVAEEGLIRLLYLEPELASSPLLPEAKDFSSPELGRLYTVLLGRLREGRAVSADVLGGELEAGEVSLLVDILQKPEALSNSKQALEDYINRIRNRRRAKELGSDPMQIYQQRRQEIK
jgi:DNA primase